MLACKGDTFATMIVGFHLNQVGILNSTDDFCFSECNFPYHKGSYKVMETKYDFYDDYFNSLQEMWHTSPVEALI
jgi:hypothetical protein